MFDSYYIYPDRDLYFREGLSASELSVTRTSDQRIQLQGSAPPNTSVTILASPDSSPTSFAAVGYVSSDASGTWSYVDAPAANVSRRFYLAGWP